MRILTDVLVLAGAGAFAVVAFAMGEAALAGATTLVRRAGSDKLESPEAPQSPAVSLLVGYGICALVGVALAIVHLFYWWALVVAAVAALVLSRRRLASLAAAARARRQRRSGRRDPFWIVCFLVAAVQLAAMCLGALAPPSGFDELSYHLPEASTVAAIHHLPLTLDHLSFYGNLPTLLEVLYAEGLALGNYSLAHLLHASIFIAFVFVAYSVVRELYGSRAAILAAALIVTVPEATANAQTLYIDTATTSFECGAVLLVLAWVVDRRPNRLAPAGLLAGLALGAKYSSAASVAFAVAVAIVAIAAAQDRGSTLKAVATAGSLGVLLCAFWYVKNAVRFGNPVYPLYLGHSGISGPQYANILASIQQFGPRTLHALIRVPSRLGHPIDLPAFVTFAIAPFAVLVRRHWIVSASLAGYFVLYVFYWFFLATHQTRFLLPALFIGSIAVALVAVSGPTLVRLAAVLVAAAWLLFLHSSVTLDQAALRTDVYTRLSVDADKYLVGERSKDEFLAGRIGCQYTVVRYLPDHDLHGGVIDDWSPLGFGYDLQLYEQNEFVQLPADASRLGAVEVSRWLGDHDIKYLFERDTERRAAEDSTLSFIGIDTGERLAADTRLLRASRLVYRDGGCSLYRLSSDSSQPSPKPRHA